ncbi:MAG: glycine zipper domain-containing protein [Pacificimonas sp.]
MRNSTLTIVPLTLLVGLGACEVTGDDTADAAITGAAAGAAVGEVTSGDPVEGGLIGAGVGAAGEVIADEIDDDDDPFHG